MRLNETVPVALLSVSLLAGCEGDVEQTTNFEPAPERLVSVIGDAALKGVSVVPYVTNLEGASAERAFAQVNGEVSCSPVGEQREVEKIDMLYAWDEDRVALVQFEPPTSEDQIFANFEGITENTVQCVRFDSGDKFINGVPVSGVFETGEREFVIKPDNE